MAKDRAHVHPVLSDVILTVVVIKLLASNDLQKVKETQTCRSQSWTIKVRSGTVSGEQPQRVHALRHYSSDVLRLKNNQTLAGMDFPFFKVYPIIILQEMWQVKTPSTFTRFKGDRKYHRLRRMTTCPLLPCGVTQRRET